MGYPQLNTFQGDLLLRSVGGGSLVALVWLRADDDFMGWFEACRDAEARANLFMEGRLAVPGEDTQRPIITYPGLCNVRGVRWVYVAWRHRVRMRHRVAKIDKLRVSDLAEMREELAGQMQLGCDYTWVLAKPRPAPSMIVPEPTEWVRYGWLTDDAEGTVPVWPE